MAQTPMAQTPMAKRRLRRRLRVALVAAVVIMLAAAVSTLATLAVEPLRGYLWAARGAACGTVETFEGASPRVGGTPNEQCLRSAAQRCQAATLTYDQKGLDTDYTITVVSEPAVPYVAS